MWQTEEGGNVMNTDNLSIDSKEVKTSALNIIDMEILDRLNQQKSDNQLEQELASIVEENTLSFPIGVFPEKLQRIARILHDDEGLNLDYLCASMLTVLAAAMGNQWMCQFTTT